MITVAFGICFSHDDEYLLENGTYITGWNLIHNNLYKSIKNQQHPNLQLFQYKSNNYCLTNKVYGESKNFITLPIKSMYEDFKTFDLLPFHIILKNIGLANIHKYTPSMLAISTN